MHDSFSYPARSSAPYLLISIRFFDGDAPLSAHSNGPFIVAFAHSPETVSPLPFDLRLLSYRLASGRLVFLRENIFGEPGVPDQTVGTRPPPCDRIYGGSPQHKALPMIVFSSLTQSSMFRGPWNNGFDGVFYRTLIEWCEKFHVTAWNEDIFKYLRWILK